MNSPGINRCCGCRQSPRLVSISGVFIQDVPCETLTPFLLAVVCMNLASKVEEMGHLSPNNLVSAYLKAAKRWPTIESLIGHQHPLNSNLIKNSEAEFCLVEMLDCSLIVYHPYRTLLQFRNDMKNSQVPNADQLCQDAWRVCNDSLRSDVALLYPPHMIAIASIMVAAILNGREKDKEKELKNWLADLNVDYEKVFEIQSAILSLYRVWRTFDEPSQIRALIEKLPRQFQQPIPSNPGGQSSMHLQ